MSTYAGYTTAGILGGICATLGLAAPAIIIILIIAKVLQQFRDNIYVEKTFYGLRPASIAMIAAAGINVAKTSLINLDAFHSSGSILKLFSWPSVLLAVIIYIVQKKTNWHPILFIILAAVAGIIFKF